MDLTSLESIEAALRLVDTKKKSLKQAFDVLHSRSHLLKSFNLRWADLDSYFTSHHSELLAQISELREPEPLQTQKESESLQKQKPPRPKDLKDAFSTLVPVPSRPKLKSLCENMDGLGLRKYVLERPKERTAVRVELSDAFKHSPDPGSMVLDALEAFWDDKAQSHSRLRTACVTLLEELMNSGLQISSEARERAIAVASEWKLKMATVDAVYGGDDDEGKEGQNLERGSLERLAYLQLLATYNLMSEGLYDLNEVVDCVVWSSRYPKIVDLCLILGLESKISDIVVRLISNGKQLLALKFIFEFELTDKFPPVPLLKAYVMDCQKMAQKVRKNGKSSHQSLNDAATREISSLKSVIKCIEHHDLESEYPKAELVAHLANLEKEKADRKRSASATTAPKHQKQAKRPKQNGSKQVKGPPPSFSKLKVPAAPLHLPTQRALLYSDQAAPYLHSHYAVPPHPPSSYVGPSGDMYGLSGARVPFSGASASNLYGVETHAHAQPVYYDAGVGYNNGYDVQSHLHQVYYPQ